MKMSMLLKSIIFGLMALNNLLLAHIHTRAFFNIRPSSFFTPFNKNYIINHRFSLYSYAKLTWDFGFVGLILLFGVDEALATGITYDVDAYIVGS